MIHHFMRFPGGKPKAVTFSYDDGVRHDIRLAQICNQYGIKCTFNLNSAFIAAEPGGVKLCADEIKQHFLDAGHEIAIHGHEHKAPGAFRPLEAIDEILTCRRALERTFGIIVRGMAYPNTGILKLHKGNTYEGIRGYLEDLEIAYGRSLDGDNNGFMLPQDWLNWVPTAHHKNPKALEWANEFAALDAEALRTVRRYPRLFYLWGHSYEFHNDGNWDLLENLCQTLGGKEDTWYATNMEICEYVHAYDALIYNADTTKVYNPTATPVWLNFSDKQGTSDINRTYCVHPGETLLIRP